MKPEVSKALKFNPNTFKVNEIFSSVQGEGVNTGVPCIFIRLALCNLSCYKCDSIAAGTPILTENRGWISIENIKEGEEIIGVSKEEENHPLQNRWFYVKASATSLKSHVENKALQINTEDGNKVICTYNHEILVRRKSVWQWVIANELKVGDILWSINTVSNYDINFVETKDFILGWIAGYDSGDGGWSNPSKNTRRYESVDPLITDRLENYLLKLNYKYYRQTRNIKTGIIYCIDSKFITKNLHTPTKEWMRGFVSGMFDAEGSNNVTLPEFSNKNITLLKKVKKFLKMWNFTSKILPRKDGTYNLRVLGGALERFRFDAVFQYSKIGHRNKWLWNGIGRRGAYPFSSYRQAKLKTKIISIKKINKSIQFYDIGSSCGNFIANGIVVHNTPYTWLWEGTTFKYKNDIRYNPCKEITEMTFDEVMTKIKSLTDKRGWLSSTGYTINHIVITGGEPLLHLKNYDLFKKLLITLVTYRFHIEIETNGTIQPPDDITKIVHQFNVSPKLSSFFDTSKSIKLDVLKYFVNTKKAYFKFVVSDKKDIDEILKLQQDCNIPSDKILLMPEGISDEEICKKSQDIVNLCMDRGFRFCNRLHVWIWGGTKRGV